MRRHYTFFGNYFMIQCTEDSWSCTKTYKHCFGFWIQICLCLNRIIKKISFVAIDLPGMEEYYGFVGIGLPWLFLQIIRTVINPVVSCKKYMQNSYTAQGLASRRRLIWIEMPLVWGITALTLTVHWGLTDKLMHHIP